MNYSTPAMGYAPHSGRGETATKDNTEGGRVLGMMAWGSGRGALGLNLARQNLVLCATCCIISVLTQWGATLVINLKGGGRGRAAPPPRAGGRRMKDDAPRDSLV